MNVWSGDSVEVTVTGVLVDELDDEVVSGFVNWW